MKTYKTTLTLFYKAKNSEEALYIADALAGEIEDTEWTNTGKKFQVEVKTGNPRVTK